MPLSPIEAIVSYTFQNPGAGPRGGMGTFRCTERDAQYLIEHLGRCGYVIAPKEPTVRMFEAAWAEAQTIAKENSGAVGRDEVIHVVDRYFRSMIEARPK